MSIDFSNKNSYEILGVKEYSTNTEITERYKELKAKYSEDRFLPGDAGNDAAQMLEAIENAYVSIMTERKADGFREEPQFPKSNFYNNTDNSGYNTYNSANNTENTSFGGGSEKPMCADVDALIKAGKIDEAQNALDNYSDRLAEWHYLQAVIYYKKNWGNECKKQLEIAMTKDPANKKYKDTYEKLCKEIEFKNKNFQSGNTTHTQSEPTRDFDPYDRQMGGDDCMSSCCQCLACNALLNCCCNCR